MLKRGNPGKRERNAIAIVSSFVLLAALAACSPTTPTDYGNESPSSAESSVSAAVQAIKDKGSIRIGVFTGFPNWGLLGDDNKPAGFDIDVAKAMAKAMGVKADLVDTAINNRVPYLQSDRIDAAIAVFSITDERKKVVDFSIPYSALAPALISKKGDGISGISDLGGKTVAVTSGQTSADAVKAQAPKDTTFVAFDGAANTLLALKQGKVDAAVEGSTGLAEFAKENSEFEIKGPLIKPFSEIAVGFKKGNDGLVEWTNAWLEKSLKDGEIQGLWQKWFGDAPFPLDEG